MRLRLSSLSADARRAERKINAAAVVNSKTDIAIHRLLNN